MGYTVGLGVGCTVGLSVGWAVGAAVVGCAVGAAVGAKVAKHCEPLVGSVTKPSKQAQKTAFEPSLCGTNEQYVD